MIGSKIESFIFNILGETYNTSRNTSQIVGHYNWEIVIDKNKVKGMLGRMNNSTGPFYTNSFYSKNGSFDFTYIYDKGITKDFFNDGNLVSKKYFNNDSIYLDYGEEDLSFGHTKHNYGNGEFFEGEIKSFSFGKSSTIKVIISSKITLKSNYDKLDNKYSFPLIGIGNVKKINIKVNTK